MTHLLFTVSNSVLFSVSFLVHFILITIVNFNLKERLIRQNNRNRKHTLSDNIISNQLNRLEWPLFTEGHRMLTIGEKGILLFKKGIFSEDEHRRL